MSNGLLKEVLNDYARRRQENQWEEDRRLKEVENKVPQVAKLVEDRRVFFFDQLKKAINQAEEDIVDAEKMIDEYNKQIRDELVKGGFAEDYLQPIYDCNLCKDTGYVGEPLKKRCQCLSSAYKKKKAEEKTPWGRGNHTFENYDEKVYSDELIPSLGISQRAYMAIIKEKAYRYAQEFPNNSVPDMLFVGQSGLGKTFLMESIAQSIFMKGYAVMYMTAYQFIELARQAHFSNQWELLDPIIQCDLLLIDDLGIEPMMENITIIQLFRTIDQRQQGGRHTIISTNLNSVEIQNRYTERISSRLLNPRQCELMAFLGEDVRRRE